MVEANAWSLQRYRVNIDSEGVQIEKPNMVDADLFQA
jgi:hypothetical protein